MGRSHREVLKGMGGVLIKLYFNKVRDIYCA